MNKRKEERAAFKLFATIAVVLVIVVFVSQSQLDSTVKSTIIIGGALLTLITSIFA